MVRTSLVLAPLLVAIAGCTQPMRIMRIDGGTIDAPRDAPTADAPAIDAPPDASDTSEATDAGGCAGCDDGNPCTDDTCEAGECTFTAIDGAYDDGSFCTVGEMCVDGRPTVGTSRDCVDGVACTLDVCMGTGCRHFTADSLCTAAAGGICDPRFGCQYGACSAATCFPSDGCETARCEGAICRRSLASCPAGEICCSGICTSRSDCPPS